MTLARSVTTESRCEIAKHFLDSLEAGFEVVDLAFTWLRSVQFSTVDIRKDAHYWWEINTLGLASLTFCPSPVELHSLCAVLQLEHGLPLSQRIWTLGYHLVIWLEG